MTESIDSIILAGDRHGSRAIAGQSKLFLQINGRSLLIYVVQALMEVERVRRIVIIGPREPILTLLLAAGLSKEKPIDVLEQHDTGYQNFWSAFQHTLGSGSDAPGTGGLNTEATPVLVLPADIPLLTADEVDQFLDQCTDPGLDYGIGMTDRRHLRRFLPREGIAGIKMPCLHVRDGDLRLNNLHFIRPFRVHNREYLEQVYQFRHQKEFRNMARVVLDILRGSGIGLRPVYLYVMLQLSMLFDAMGMNRMFRATRSRVTREEMTRYAGKLLNAHVEIIETTGGGCAVDVDNDRDYVVISQRFAEFSEHREAGSDGQN